MQNNIQSLSFTLLIQWHAWQFDKPKMVGKTYNASSCNEGGCKAQTREAMDGEAVGEQKKELGEYKLVLDEHGNGFNFGAFLYFFSIPLMG